MLVLPFSANTVLILNALGLDASPYMLHLGDTIFELIGFKPDRYSDEIFKGYLQQCKKVNAIDLIASPSSLDQLAADIFTWLSHKRPQS